MKEFVLGPVCRDLSHKMAPFAVSHWLAHHRRMPKVTDDASDRAGVLEARRRGKIFVEGPLAPELIRELTATPTAALRIGQVLYCCLSDVREGVLDDLLVYRLATEKYMVVVNASQTGKSLERIVSHNHGQVALINRSGEIARIAVEGPFAIHALQRMTTYRLDMIPHYHFRELLLYGIPNVIIANTGYTGIEAFELYVPDQLAARLSKGIKAICANFFTKPKITMSY